MTSRQRTSRSRSSAAEQIDRCAAFGRLLDRADDRAGFTAFGDGHEHVLRADAEVGRLPPAEVLIIFERLDRLDQCIVAAGHDAGGRIGEGIARRSKVFAPHRFEQDAEPPGCAAAGEDDAPTVADRADAVVGHPGEGGGPENAFGHSEHVAVRFLERADAVGG